MSNTQFMSYFISLSFRQMQREAFIFRCKLFTKISFHIFPPLMRFFKKPKIPIFTCFNRTGNVVQWHNHTNTSWEVLMSRSELSMDSTTAVAGALRIMWQPTIIFQNFWSRQLWMDECIKNWFVICRENCHRPCTFCEIQFEDSISKSMNLD